MSGARIDFLRLTEVPVEQVVRLLNEPRNARHMPLAAHVTEESAAEWVRTKDAQWDEHGYGPWAVLVDGVFAGWGGFQREEAGADLALVLAPAYWGHGRAVTRAALRRGFEDLELDVVSIALPRSRDPERAVRRFGFEPDGEVLHDGIPFRRYRLTREAWHRTGGAAAG